MKLLQNKSLKNASWIIGCKVVQSLVNLLVGMLTARYLGPSGYGLVSYAAAIVAFVTPLMQLGLHSTLVQELISDPQQEGTTLGSAIGCSLTSSALCILGVIAFAFLSNGGDPNVVLICGLQSLVLIFQACELLQYWFQAKLLSKYPSVIMLVAYVVVAAYKIFLLATGKSVYWFALSNTIDAVLIAAGMMAVYHYQRRQKLTFSFKRAKQLLNRSKYYILPAMVVVIFQQTDRIMLKNMVDDVATGHYSAAVTCAGLAGFVFAAIIDSARSPILSSRKRSVEEFEQKLKYLYCIIFLLALAQSLFMTVFAEPIVQLLYGRQYGPTAPALRVVTWYVPFAYLGSAQSIWILAEDRQKYFWILSVSGAVTNVVLNYFLIPIWGPVGAGVASVIAQAAKNLLIGFILPPLRHNNYLMLSSLHPKNILSLFRLLLSRK